MHATAVTASQNMPAGQLSVSTVASCCTYSLPGPWYYLYLFVLMHRKNKCYGLLSEWQGNMHWLTWSVQVGCTAVCDVLRHTMPVTFALQLAVHILVASTLSVVDISCPTFVPKAAIILGSMSDGASSAQKVWSTAWVSQSCPFCIKSVVSLLCSANLLGTLNTCVVLYCKSTKSTH